MEQRAQWRGQAWKGTSQKWRRTSSPFTGDEALILVVLGANLVWVSKHFPTDPHPQPV